MSDIAYRICKNPDCGHRFRDHTSMKTENKEKGKGVFGCLGNDNKCSCTHFF